MKKLQLDKLSENEMSLIKGGEWIIVNGKLEWVDLKNLEDDDVPPPPPPPLLS